MLGFQPIAFFKNGVFFRRLMAPMEMKRVITVIRGISNAGFNVLTLSVNPKNPFSRDST